MNEIMDRYLDHSSPLVAIRSEVRRLIMKLQEHVEEKKAAGKVEGQHDQMPVSVCDSVNQLGKDWDFLLMFVISDKLRCPPPIDLNNPRSIDLNKVRLIDLKKVDNEAKKIYRNLSSCGKYVESPKKILGLLCKCQSDTVNLFKLEFPDASLYYYSPEPYIVTERIFDRQYFSDVVRLVVENLRSLEEVFAGDAVLKENLCFLSNELLSIRRYLLDVTESPRYKINPYFLHHIYVVLWMIAWRACNLWFIRGDPSATKMMTDALERWRRRIDPIDGNFLELIFRFLTEDINNESAAPFCRYILLDLMTNQDLTKDLLYLLQNQSRTPGADRAAFAHIDSVLLNPDGRSVFAEIGAVLKEAAFSCRWLQRRRRPANSLDPPPEEVYLTTAASQLSSHLLAKLCLLNTELFLVDKINTLTPTSFSMRYQVDEILGSLREFTKQLWILSDQANSEYVKRNLVLAQELGNEIDSFDNSFHSKRIPDPLVRPTLQHWFFKIAFFKAESFLSDLLKSSDSSLANKNGQIQSLVQELKFFKTMVTYKLTNYSSDEKAVLNQVEAVVRWVTLLSYSIPDNNKKFLIIAVPYLLDRAKIIKAKLKENSQQFPRIIFPLTFELGFIDILGRHISELSKHYPLLIAPVTDIEELLLQLQSLKSFFAKLRDSDAGLGVLKDLRNHIMEVAYKLEYVVDSIEVGGHLHHSLWLYDLLEDIRLVHQQVSRIHHASSAGEVKDSPQLIPARMVSPSRETTIEANEMLMDLDDEEKVIIKRLRRGSKQRDVVSIVGMAGSGKTTLARKLYNHQNVMYHFSRRAWCTVSQSYSKRELLLQILSHMPVPPDEISQLTDHDLLSKLRRCLLRNRYLIVMDDVWDTAAWNDLEYYFPDDNNGSRILISSRLRDVVSEIKPDSNPHFIRPFSNEESWTLLQKKIFRGGDCPADLLEAGMEIARQCQGLPLAVVTIAGLLRRTEKGKDSWQKVSKSLSSEIINNPENQCKEILELSYNHLPEYLKPCFLYLGVFLQDKNIPVSKVIRFWMAEGFIEETDSKRIEEVAEDYLLELINRSLVNVYKERSNGRARSCHLHDLLRDLSHLKAEEENFLQRVNKHDKPYAFFPDTDYGMEFDSMDQFAPETFKSYRLSFYLKRKHFIDSRPSGLGGRSLTFFASVDSEPKCPYDISFICKNFKLLRLLDLEDIMAIDFPAEIGVMTQLRYLAISGYMQYVPPSIAELWRLETLIVNGLRGQVILPETIWSMERLRHLRVNKYVGLSFGGFDKQVGSSFLLQNLVSLSTPSLSCGEDASSIFERMPNLRKLRCIFFQSWNSSADCKGFPVLDFLTHLEALKIMYYGRAINGGEFVLPSNLKKLTLSKFGLQGNHLSMIGKLPHLQILKLLSVALEGRKWVMEEEGFKELLFLELDSMNIAEWNGTYDHLPILERLMLRNCKDLEVIPSDFAYINSLKSIEVQWCKQSVVESAEAIHEETNEIEVLVTRF